MTTPPSFRVAAPLPFCVVLTSVGCSATGQKFTPETSAPADKALIYLYRVGRFEGSLAEPHIFVNGDHTTNLVNASYAVTRVPPGDIAIGVLPRLHEVFMLENLLNRQRVPSERLRFRVAAGKTYYIRWQVGHIVEVVPESIAQAELQELRLAPPISRPVK